MSLKISVITCAHNPNKSYLDRVLQSLLSQTLSFDQWEYLLIDNASTQHLDTEVDLTWHPNAKCMREDKLGLTSARLRGIHEAQADILVFVDDDNILDPDYLEIALSIGKDYPFIGAWGGQIQGDFEIEPPKWTESYLPLLGIRKFDQPMWSNLLHQHQTTPCGVGMCVRKTVAQKYVELVLTDPKRIALGRIGNQLMSCEDTDLAFTACDIGLGTGQFPTLRTKHIIPASRLEEDYLVRLCEGMIYSHTILDSFRNRSKKISWKDRFRGFYEQMRKPSKEERRIYRAQQRGLHSAIQKLAQSSTN
jgi:glycosyltransferase involved in cell wall biosynthesis